MQALQVALMLTLCAFNAVVCHRNSRALEPFFRKDYTYDGRQLAFYKVHRLARSWRAAHAICNAEGSELSYPETQEEAKVLQKVIGENLPKEWGAVWVGGHDLFSEGIHVTMNGKDLSSMYSNWAPGEPNDAANNEDCVAYSSDGMLRDLNCETRLPVICKKDLKYLTSNPICETSDLAYIPNANKTRCYKVHTTPQNWSDAFATCHAEQSYLTIINDHSEANFIVSLLQKFAPNGKGHVGVGFHDLYKEGQYLTIHGKTVGGSTYCDWQNGQPDNYKGNENCGSITYSGKLNDINCNALIQFVCERELGDPNIVDLFSRFKDTNF